MTSGKHAIAVLATTISAATFHGTRMATRLAITPRNKEGQVHYFQPDVQETAPAAVRPPRR